MGRYYTTDGGREGKFMFAVQSSDDPELLGMHEQEPTEITYYADEDDAEHIKSMLDREYDALDIPKDKRVYYRDKDDYKEWYKYEDEVLHDKVFVSVRDDDKETLAKHAGETRWGSNKSNYCDFEINGNAIHMARIRLAVNILSDIKDNGYCTLDAEL